MAEPSKVRPFGEILVEVYRPPARFGHGISFGVHAEGGGVLMAKVGENGGLEWVPVEQNVFIDSPTLYLDNHELAALDRALRMTPVRYKGDASVEHLADAIQVRDRLLALVEKGFSNFHDPRILFNTLNNPPS